MRRLENIVRKEINQFVDPGSSLASPYLADFSLDFCLKLQYKLNNGFFSRHIDKIN